MDPIETERPPESRCETCQRPVAPPGPFGMWTPGEGCQNPICGMSDRAFGCCYAVALDRHPLKTAIRRYKYGRESDVGAAAKRLAVTLAWGVRDLKIPIRKYDLIVGMPSYVDETTERQFNHVDLILEKLNELTNRPLPIRLGDRSPIVKTGPTDAMAQASGWQEREHIAVTQLRPRLRVQDPDAVEDSTVLVVDDLFTTGHSLREVSRALLRAGADEVDGLVLARAVYAH